MSELVINYKTDGGHGTMRLILDNCLPCEPSWLKKVLRVVHMADNSEELEAELLLYLNELFDNLEDPAEYFSAKASACKRTLEDRARSERRIRKCLKLLGQEEAECQQVMS